MTGHPEDDARGPLDADTFDDADSAMSAPLTSSLTSLRSSVLAFQEENGRTYHSMSSGKYNFPNDMSETERLDLQHNLWLLTLKGRLGLSPKIDGPAKRVLDAGTGTGIWAIEYADAHPEAEVIGVDLSPIQPSMYELMPPAPAPFSPVPLEEDANSLRRVPPNCSFEVDDLEKDWTWTIPFDFILARVMTGSFQEMQEFVNKAYENLEPGGYLELQDITHPYACDDGTLDEDSELARVGKLIVDAGTKAGRPINDAPQYKEYLQKAGFTDIVEKKFKWPLNQWPRDRHYKELGAWSHENLNRGIEGLVMALFTRHLDWTPEQVILLCSEARKQLANPRIHAYMPIYVVYGRKPEEKKSPSPP